MKKMNYKAIAKNVISLEIKALQKLKKSLNKNLFFFNRLISKMGKMKGSINKYKILFLIKFSNCLKKNL